MTDITEERLGFDTVPEIYHRVRPTYPEPLFDDLFAYVSTTSRSPAVVEIGPGTGKATKPLLERGASVTAVEIGPRLAAFLQDKLAAAFPDRLQVINASFEACALPLATYDAVVSATAFHWVQADVRLQKSRDLLRPGGALAIIGTNQIRSEIDRGFFARVFPIYKKYNPLDDPAEPPGADVVPREYQEIVESGLFEDVMLHRYRWDQTYRTAAYADLVRSYSVTQVMEPAAREGLIAELSGVIDEEYGGSVTRPLVITLTLGRKPR
ncbi:MAG: class I SAM-dependent methyltransferase [Dehalococcoidia bacterium]